MGVLWVSHFLRRNPRVASIVVVSRSARPAITKADKAVSRANARVARLEAQNRRLKLQLLEVEHRRLEQQLEDATQQPHRRLEQQLEDAITQQPQRKRKRITVDANDIFAAFDDIMNATNKAREEEAREAAIRTTSPTTVQAAPAAVQASSKSMCTWWKLQCTIILISQETSLYSRA
ncbi:hypothetical protein K504DRAFT_493602 [Pleomassaria siparia CBS 279.74]|uniref:Uncharacterized protein n=1 Tax=Pleomassaria siparia CBS 279.74 TaxID=1314801 RepID=A0A6G1K280_9PLEO|nr:hypothetical protein K504DRAFT_493602 [Pleomassaria siparia CBS 279.74]